MKSTAPLLAVAVVTAGVIAALAQRQPTAPGAKYEPVRAPGAAQGSGEAASDEGGGTLRGKVLEAIDVAEYTYLRLATPSGEQWSAVSKASVKVGSTVEVREAARMEDFQSPTLGRTFPVIYFGRLGSDPAPALPPGHPNVSEPSSPLPGHPSARAPAPADLPDVTVPKARGEGAYVIAELYGSREKLRGAVVRVSGQVVKVTTGVLGKNYVRLRDGSSTSPEQRELVATTLASSPVGSVVTLRGTLQTDVDVGIGYSYAVLLADAEVEPSR